MTVIDWGEYNRPPYINAKRITNDGPEGVTYDEATQTLNISNVKLSPDSVDFKLIYFQYLTDADLTGLDISDTTTLSRCFENSQLNSLNISNWNTENITYMNGMFMMASFPDGYILDLSSFNTKNVSVADMMFDLVETTVYINPDTWTLTPEQTSGQNCTFIEKRPVPPAEDLQTKIKKDIQSATQALATLTKTELGKCIKSSDVTDTVESGNMNPVTSNAVNGAMSDKVTTDQLNGALTNYKDGIIMTDIDLNNYKTCGKYVSSEMTEYLNTPSEVNKFFCLEVIRSINYAGYDYKIQKLISYSGTIFIRIFDAYQNTWYSWEQIATKNEQTMTYTGTADLYNGFVISNFNGNENIIDSVKTDDGYIVVPVYQNDGSVRVMLGNALKFPDFPQGTSLAVTISYHHK